MEQTGLGGGGPLVLCVDDEALVGDVVSRILETRLGCRVEYLASGRDALRRLAEADVSALVIDYVMPGMNGGELYRRLCRERPDLADRCLFITGDTLTQKTLDAIRATGRPSLEKPFGMPELTEAVRGLLVPVQSSRR